MTKNNLKRNSDSDIKFEPKIFNLKGFDRKKFWTLKNKIIFGLAIILIGGIVICLGLIPIYSGKDIMFSITFYIKNVMKIFQERKIKIIY